MVSPDNDKHSQLILAQVRDQELLVLFNTWD